MRKVHTLKSIQKIPLPPGEAWDFFSDPSNLLLLTPPFLQLRVTNDVYGERAYPGQILTYRVKPFWGIPWFWMTEITHLEPGKMFVDEQKWGPYRIWHHQHHFAPIPGGVVMTDLVHYGLPMGLAGELAHAWFVKKKLHGIFAYRFQKINESLGSWPQQQMDIQMT
ncbi:MAG: SRPBCC family protein [Flavisolibacter sp.]